MIPTIPDTPTNLQENEEETTGNQASFTWTAPADNVGLPILDYSVEQYNDANGSFAEVASSLTETSYTQTSLSENTDYKFRVRARNSLGFGDYSSELELSTDLVNIG